MGTAFQLQWLMISNHNSKVCLKRPMGPLSTHQNNSVCVCVCAPLSMGVFLPENRLPSLNVWMHACLNMCTGSIWEHRVQYICGCVFSWITGLQLVHGDYSSWWMGCSQCLWGPNINETYMKPSGFPLGQAWAKAGPGAICGMRPDSIRPAE